MTGIVLSQTDTPETLPTGQSTKTGPNHASFGDISNGDWFLPLAQCHCKPEYDAHR